MKKKICMVLMYAAFYVLLMLLNERIRFYVGIGQWTFTSAAFLYGKPGGLIKKIAAEIPSGSILLGLVKFLIWLDAKSITPETDTSGFFSMETNESLCPIDETLAVMVGDTNPLWGLTFILMNVSGSHQRVPIKNAALHVER